MSLWSQLAEESADRCDTSAHADINTVRMRIKHEGLSFLTITLPDYGKAIQKWLDQGQAGFHPAFVRERGRGFPRFLGGFLGRVFDRSSGALLDVPCEDAILALRQLTLMFGKMELECSKERQRSALRKYIECEKEVREFDSQLTSRDIREFTDVSNLLFETLFTRWDRDVFYGRVLPKHGPGSTADSLSGNRKYSQSTWTTRLERVFPAGEHILPNWKYYDQLEDVTFLEPGQEQPVKVTLVPKTLKTPRVIAMEPTCMQYMQQALYGSFLEHFQKDDFLRSVIGFDDQTPNQELARRGSLDNRTATLDLSDASDRVSNQLVRAMLARWPLLQEAVDATRSRRADVDGEVIRLSKYASMGSALCFPMEAMVFLTSIFVGLQRGLNRPLSRKDMQSFSGSVRVYGDDLIVPVDFVSSVVSSLEHFGARVGVDKSFWTGKFRESCGKEFFNGTDVSIVRVRQEFPARRQYVTREISTATGKKEAERVISLVSLRNQLYMSGYWRTVRWLDDYIRKSIKFFPTVAPTSPVQGRVSFLGYETQKMHPRFQSPLVRGFVVEAKPPRDNLDGTGALLKCLLKLETGTMAERPWLPEPEGERDESLTPHLRAPLAGDERHLERTGRPRAVSIKLKWRSPF